MFGLLPGTDERLHKSRAGDRRRADRGRVRAALQDRRDRRRPVGQGGQLPHLLVLARLRPGHRRRASTRPRPDGAAAARRLAARPLRRGVRRRHRPAPRQLPPGVLAPRADRGRRRDDQSLAPTRIGRRPGVGHERFIRRDRDRQRRRRRHARRTAWRPSGKRILLLERGGWLPREPQNWRRRGRVRRRPLRLARHLVLLGRLGRSSPRCTTTSAARPSATAPRCTGCARRTSAS